jgi:hypothetical protein
VTAWIFSGVRNGDAVMSATAALAGKDLHEFSTSKQLNKLRAPLRRDSAFHADGMAKATPPFAQTLSHGWMDCICQVDF